MKKIILINILLALVASFSFADGDKYTIKNTSKFSSKILTETCQQELDEAIAFVMNSPRNKSENNLVAVLPEEIGYQYFSILFKYIKDDILSPDIAFEYEFEYWFEDIDGELKCTRVEPMDYIY